MVQTPYQAPNANSYAERFVRATRKHASTGLFQWASVTFNALYVNTSRTTISNGTIKDLGIR